MILFPPSASCRTKSCIANTLPIPQLKLVADLIAPFLTKLFNRSLSSAIVPQVFKSALITPLLKKPDLDSVDPRSYRPISNLPVVSKILKRFPAALPDLLPRLQSACWTHHSTETAVLKVLTDILYAVDDGNLSVLALLDVSAAFDTVDHDILLTPLKVSFGIKGAALNWFQSYLTSRVECVLYRHKRSCGLACHRGLSWALYCSSYTLPV